MTTNTMSAEGTKVDNFVNAAEQTLCNLWSRWQDEKEYEDINDYAQPLLAAAEAVGLPAPVMTKRPFGCKFTLNNMTFQVSVTSRSLGWKRVA